MGIQKILELNWDMGLSRNGNDGHTHTILLFMGHITQASTIVELFPHFFGSFSPIGSSVSAVHPPTVGRLRRAGGACDPARAAVRPCDCRASLQDSEQHGGGEPQEPWGGGGGLLWR